MKKIGILFGQENSFPQAFIDRVNEMNESGIKAEAVSIDKVAQAEPTDYAVIIDRISHDVPFYRAYLKNAAISGTAVLNNPFWWSADEKFFNNALAEKIGVAVPKTVILPSHARPDDTTDKSFRNLKFPQNWDSIFEYVGFPAYLKPHSGGGWKSVYRVDGPDDLFSKHSETKQLVMMLQEEIEFKEYFRCYYLGGDHVRIMQYEPRNPHHLRYVNNAPPVAKALLDKVRDGVIKLNRALGYDFNTVEFAIRDGKPYAIDFCNPAPDADINSVGQDNFDWIVQHAATMAVNCAKAHKDGQMNLTWGTFVTDQAKKGSASGAKQTSVSVKKAKSVAINAKSDNASAANQTKRIKTLSSKEITGAATEAPKRMMESDSGESGVKRGPGRPKKAKSATTAPKAADGTKRRPGRPRKTPAQAIADATARTERKKPGPKPGSKRNTAKSALSADGTPKVKGKPGPKPGSKRKTSKATTAADGTPKVKGKPGPKPGSKRKSSKAKTAADGTPKVKGKPGPKPGSKRKTSKTTTTADGTPQIKGKPGPKPGSKRKTGKATTTADDTPNVKGKPGPKPGSKRSPKSSSAATGAAKGKPGPKPGSKRKTTPGIKTSVPTTAVAKPAPSKPASISKTENAAAPESAAPASSNTQDNQE